MEFLQDGRLLLKHADGSTSIARYEFGKKRVMRIRQLAADPADYRVTLERDSLVLCEDAAAAQCFRFSRAAVGGR